MPITSFKFGDYSVDSGPFQTESEGSIGIADLDGFVPTLNGYVPVPRGYPIGYIFGNAYSANTTRTDSDVPISLYSYVNASDVNQWLFLKTNCTQATSDIQRATSGVGGTSIGRAGGYTDSTGWSLCRYGDTIIATNGIDAVQRASLTGSFSKNNDTSGTPTAADPRANYVETFKSMLWYGGVDFTAGSSGTAPETYGGAFGPFSAAAYPATLMNSMQENERRFGAPDVTSALLGANYRHLYDGLGDITGLKACSDYMAIFRTGGVTIMTGPPFNVQNIDESIGTLASNSIVRVGADLYFWSNRGPARILGGGKFELLAGGIFSEAMGIASTPAQAIYGAVTTDSKYVVWTCQLDPLTTINTFYVYSLESGRFGRWKETDAGSVGPMCSYKIPIINIQPIKSLTTDFIQIPFKRYSPLEGISFIANDLPYVTTSPSGATGVDILMLSGAANNSSYTISATGPIGSATEYGVFGDLATIKTHYFQVPGGDTPQAFVIKQVRPIYWTGSASAHNNPNADEASEFDDEVKINKIRIYPLSRYESSSNGLYNEYSGVDDNGWIKTPDCPQAELMAIEFFFENNYNLRLIYGFEMEFAPLSAYTTGKSTY